MTIARFALLPVLLAASAGAADLKQTLAVIDRSAASFKALSADFKRVHHIDVINADDLGAGSMLVKKLRPKEFAALISFTEPNQDRYSLNGRKARHYAPKLNVVEEYDLDKKMGSQVNQYLLLGFGTSSAELQAGYDVAMGGAETLNGQKATRLQLTPRKPDAMNFKRVDMWISDETGLTVQLKLHEGGGDYHLFTYTNLKLLPAVPDSDLDIKAPKNAKVEHPLK